MIQEKSKEIKKNSSREKVFSAILSFIKTKKKIFRKENFVFLSLTGFFTLIALFFVFRIFLPASATGTFSDDFTTIDSCDATYPGSWKAIGGTVKANDVDIRVE